MAIAPAVSQRAQPPCVRLISAGLIEQHHQSEASTRRYLSEASMRQLDAFDLALIDPDAGMLSGVIRIPDGLRHIQKTLLCAVMGEANPSAN